MKKILIITNGHGEDQTAAQIIRALGNDFDIWVLPLVGEGKEFGSLSVNILGNTKALPSGGFSLRNIFALPKDIFNGLFSLFYSQIKTLRSVHGQFDLVISIGDIIPIFGAMLTKCPFIFIGVNKSEYYKSLAFNYTTLEKWILKTYAKVVFVRDQITFDTLKKQGLNVLYAGNPIMDGLKEISNNKDQDPNESKIIGFLPGTRTEDIEKNLEDFKAIEIELHKIDRNLQFLTAYKNQKYSFEEILYNSDIVVGLSGTGNEQAAGMGKPVVAFVGRGAQYNKKFAKAQTQLLGDALCLVKRDPKVVAHTIWEILQDKVRIEYMSQTGITHMGTRGAVTAIAEKIREILR